MDPVERNNRDLIVYLVDKLADPSERERLTAARSICKILVDAGFEVHCQNAQTPANPPDPFDLPTIPDAETERALEALGIDSHAYGAANAIFESLNDEEAIEPDDERHTLLQSAARRLAREHGDHNQEKYREIVRDIGSEKYMRRPLSYRQCRAVSIFEANFAKHMLQSPLASSALVQRASP